jgi:hypothetical protein
MSSLFWIAKLMKFVSMMMRNGGPSSVLYLKNSALDVCGLRQRTEPARAHTDNNHQWSH